MAADEGQPAEASQPEYQPGELLRSLFEAGVDYVVIGGVAGSLRGSSFATSDLDVMYARDPANLERLAAVLLEVDARLFGPGVLADLPFQLDARTLANGANFTFTTRYGRFDILAEPSGAPPYGVVRRDATPMTAFGVEVLVASLPHLMRMKKAAGRPKDQSHYAEYALLLRLADEAERPGVSSDDT